LSRRRVDGEGPTDQNQPALQPENPPPAAGETIGERLKRLRLERGLSQRELAAPGVSYAYISRIEAGTRQPSVKALRRLAAKLNVSADYLETGSDLDPGDVRELRLADLELAVRLGELEGVEDALADALAEAVQAGDRAAALRARVALAQLALENGDDQRAARLLEEALAGEPFLPAERFDIYANLGRAYAGIGRPEKAVEVYQACMDAITESGGEAALAARYATLLSYALSDMGEIARAEEVVRAALEQVKDTGDPYMRVRLYWSMARLAHTKGRESVALTNVRKAIALLQATDDTFHLARAHILAASITIGREDAASAERHIAMAERLLGTGVPPEDAFEMKQHRSRIELLKGDPATAAAYAREALELAAKPADEGNARFALADSLAALNESSDADGEYARAVELLEGSGRWRSASTACRAWGRMLRAQGREAQALDVLDRAAELGMRAAPDSAHVER
jgi:transcriptional regulator with XRE-family HTH domain